MIYEFRLPDIGEGLAEGEVVKWLVKEGDSVRENQPLVNVLTDKAEVEIPSPKTGRIVKLFAEEGRKVKVGEVLVSFDVGGAGNHPPGKTSAHAPVETNGHADRPAAASRPAAAPSGPVSATPAVRKLAAELQVDISRVAGTGPGGRITEEDVRRAPAAKPAAGLEERVPFAGIRRRTAEKLALSARTIPHVTHADEADYAALVELRQELKSEAQKREIKLTFLPFILKALVKALQEFPSLNASLDEAGQEIVLKRTYNIGVATDTEQGLVVPVVKNAETKGFWELASEINRLTDKARAGKLDLAELQGGTFTVTNIGPVGGFFATPIILPPEVGILGVMKIQERAVVREGKVVARPVGALCLSFDHRVLDGAEAAHFVNALIRRIENPRTLL